MNTLKETETSVGTKEGRPAALGEKVALWAIFVIILYLVFIDK